jgi:protein phosphatase 2C family protein 2/3
VGHGAGGEEECVNLVTKYNPVLIVVVGYDTPESVPDVFGLAQSSGMGGLTGAGFRVAGAGGLANIASILGASGITFRPADDSDDEDEGELHIIGGDEGKQGKDGYIGNKALDEGLKPVNISDKLVSGEFRCEVLSRELACPAR